MGKTEPTSKMARFFLFCALAVAVTAFPVHNDLHSLTEDSKVALGESYSAGAKAEAGASISTMEKQFNAQLAVKTQAEKEDKDAEKTTKEAQKDEKTTKEKAEENVKKAAQQTAATMK